MTAETRALMQPDDSMDTAEISRLKHLFWSLHNTSRMYTYMHAECHVAMDAIECTVEVLLEDARINHRKPLNVTSPREPLPADRDGKPHSEKLVAPTELGWLRPRR